MTTRSRFPTLAVPIAVLVGFVAASCSSGDDEPTRPPIVRSLDASAYGERVCDLLPADQAVRLGYAGSGSADKATVSAAGEVPEYVFCSWFPPESARLSIDLFLAKDQLAHEYSMSRNMSIGGTNEPWVEPLTIAGQPAVTLGRSHQMPNSTCDVVVGLSDTQSLRVHATEQDDNGGRIDNGLGQGDGKACEHAMAVADVIVRELGGN